MQGFGRTSFDTETFLISPGQQIPVGVLATLLRTDANGVQSEDIAHLKFDRNRLAELLYTDFSDPRRLITGANVAFDMAVLAQEMPEIWPAVWKAYDEARVYDVLHGAKLVDLYDGERDFYLSPDGMRMVKSAYGLGDLVKRFFDEDLDKRGKDRLNFGLYRDRPLSDLPESARKYAQDDTRWTDRLFVHQVSQDKERWHNTFFQTRAAWWMQLMSAWGFAIDAKQVFELDRRITEEYERTRTLLMARGLVRGDGSKNLKAVKQRLTVCSLRTNTPLKRTESDDISTDEEACTDSKDEVLIAFARYNSLGTMISTDLRIMKEAARAKMPIQSRFEVVLNSGRTSSSGERKKKKNAPPSHRSAFSRNIQNVRKEPGFRECFVPREGHVLISIDWSQMELHTWAQACKDLVGFSELGNRLNDGVDVHSMLGSRLFGLTYEQVVKGRKVEGSVEANARQAGKPGNFGFPGGLGALAMVAYAKTQYGVILSEEDARRLKREWQELCPENFPYFEYVTQQLQMDGRIRHVRSGRVRGGVRFTDGANTLFQGLASDVAKEAGYHLCRSMYFDRTSVLYGSRIVDMVHDEFIWESPEHIAHECALAGNAIMQRVSAEWLPDYPPKSEPALMRRWYKAAEARYDENKRLIPWEPRAAA